MQTVLTKKVNWEDWDLARSVQAEQNLVEP